MSMLMMADRAGADNARPICEKSLLMPSGYKVEDRQFVPGQAGLWPHFGIEKGTSSDRTACTGQPALEFEGSLSRWL